MELLQKLVQIKSISGKEDKLASFIMDYCRENNISAQMQSGNVVIYIKGEDPSKALIFNAHMDTVSAGDLSKWQYQPYGNSAGKVINGKLYGLGASDDKGAIASMLILANNYLRVRPLIDLWFTFVSREETDGSGTESFLDWFTHTKYFKTYKKISVIIGEPTGLGVLEIGHRGNFFLKLESKGVVGHGAKSYKESDLAIGKMLKALQKVKSGFEQWKMGYKDKILEVPSLNITGIFSSASTVNQIPPVCSVTLDIRTTPKMHHKLIPWIKRQVGKSIKISEVATGKPPGIINHRSKIQKTIKSVIPGISVSVSLGSTDQSQFINSGIDTVVFGPGEKGTMHKENEFVCLSKVLKCVKIYKKIIEEFL